MSLKVWLPLTGNLDNLGLSNYTFTAHDATVNANGKLGKCYVFNGNKQWLQFSDNLGDFYNHDWSFAAWLKPTDSTRGIILSEYSGTGASNVAIELLANRNVRLYWNGTPDINFSTAGPVPINVWTHVALTKQGSTFMLYFNGVLKQTYTYSGTLSTRTSACQPRIGDDYRGNTSSDVSYQGYMNDFRLYDHALSAKEVKEIAKGLILHYKLDDPYVEGTTNLITSADGLSNTCYNGATNKYSYGTSTDMYKEVTTWQGRTGTRVHMGTNGLDAYPYVYFDPFNPTGTDYRTLSFDYYPTIQTSLVPYSYNGSYDWDCRVNGIRSTVLNSNSITLNGVRTNAWNHIEITAHRHDEGTARGTGYVRIGSAKHTSNVSNFWFFSNIQVELKDHATPYTLYNTTRVASTTVHDCSGYKHNGTPYNLLIASANTTPRYSASTYIQSGNTDYLVTNSVIGNPSDAITMSIWFRSTSTSPGSSYHEIFNHATSPQAFEFAIHSTGYFRQGMLVNGTRYVINGGTGLLDGTWHMLSATYDGTEIKRYIDGVLVSSMTQTITGTLNGANGGFLIGHYGSNTSYYAKYAYVSDARIYATALSADDILELYQTSASVDKSGNVYARELVEV